MLRTEHWERRTEAEGRVKRLQQSGRSCCGGLGQGEQWGGGMGGFLKVEVTGYAGGSDGGRDGKTRGGGRRVACSTWVNGASVY